MNSLIRSRDKLLNKMKISTRIFQAVLFLAYGAKFVEAQSSSCTFIAIVMDESASMSGEQVFLRNDAMPGVIEDIRIRLQKQVFVCSYGYPASGSFPGRVVGCSAGFDVDDYAFVTSGGGTEDGWAAIENADAHAKNLTEIDGIQLSSCSSVSTVHTTNGFVCLHLQSYAHTHR